jgi:hypothetical protein
MPRNTEWFCGVMFERLKVVKMFGMLCSSAAMWRYSAVIARLGTSESGNGAPAIAW